jgi:hypothetical protein
VHVRGVGIEGPSAGEEKPVAQAEGVRHRAQKQTAGTQHTRDFGQHRHRVGKMLEHFAENDRIERAVLERQPLRQIHVHHGSDAGRLHAAEGDRIDVTSDCAVLRGIVAQERAIAASGIEQPLLRTEPPGELCGALLLAKAEPVARAIAMMFLVSRLRACAPVHG